MSALARFYCINKKRNLTTLQHWNSDEKEQTVRTHLIAKVIADLPRLCVLSSSVIQNGWSSCSCFSPTRLQADWPKEWKNSSWLDGTLAEFNLVCSISDRFMLIGSIRDNTYPLNRTHQERNCISLIKKLLFSLVLTVKQWAPLWLVPTRISLRSVR